MPVPIDSLRVFLPEGVLLTDPDLLAGYRTDETHDPDAGTPSAVVRVTNTGQIQDTLRWAAANRVAVIPRGAGSGLAGGVSAFDDAVVLSLERLTSIEIDPVARVAYAEAGALNGDVKRAAAEHGLWYPPDPSSFEICTIGGNIATNAGGLCCVKYGVTTDYVLGLDVVLADGTLVTVGGPRIKDVAGLPALLARIEEISAAHGVFIPTVAHAGDGNLHPHVIYDETDAESVVRAHAVFAEIMHAAIELGGTITGEHGVGRAKAAYLADQLGPDVMALTRSIKNAIDPLGILNPGAGI